MPDERRRKYSLRLICEALFYLVKTGCQWRMLPPCYPPWQSVYYYFRKWKWEDTIVLLHDKLTEWVRLKKGKRPEPSAGIVDSQSVKTTAVSSSQSGFDPFKKVKGRKRHLLVDTLGFIIAVVVHSAGVQDREGVRLLFERAADRCLRVVFGDEGYWAEKLLQWVGECCRWTLQIVHKVQPFTRVQPKRWVVERTFAWISNDRRNSKDYERLTESSEAIIHLSMIKVMLKQF